MSMQFEAVYDAPYKVLIYALTGVNEQPGSDGAKAEGEGGGAADAAFDPADRHEQQGRARVRGDVGLRAAAVRPAAGCARGA